MKSIDADCEACEGTGKCPWCPDIGHCMECLSPGACWTCAGSGQKTCKKDEDEDEDEDDLLFNRDASFGFHKDATKALRKFTKFLGLKDDNEVPARLLATDPTGRKGYINWAINHARKYAQPIANDETTPLGTLVFAGPYYGELAASPPGPWKIKTREGKTIVPYDDEGNILKPRLVEPTEQALDDAQSQLAAATDALEELELYEDDAVFAEGQQLRDLTYHELEELTENAKDIRPREELAEKEEFLDGDLVRYDTRDALCLDYPQPTKGGRKSWCTTWWTAPSYWREYKDKGNDLYVAQIEGAPYHVAYNPSSRRVTEIQDRANKGGVESSVRDLIAEMLSKAVGDEVATAASGSLYGTFIEQGLDEVEAEQLQDEWLSYEIFANAPELAEDYIHYFAADSSEPASLWAAAGFSGQDAIHWSFGRSIHGFGDDDIVAIQKWYDAEIPLAVAEAWYDAFDDAELWGAEGLKLQQAGMSHAQLARDVAEADRTDEVIDAWIKLKVPTFRPDARPHEWILAGFLEGDATEYEGDLYADMVFARSFLWKNVDHPMGTARMDGIDPQRLPDEGEQWITQIAHAIRYGALTRENANVWSDARWDSEAGAGDGLSDTWLEWAAAGVRPDDVEAWRAVMTTSTDISFSTIMDYAVAEWTAQEAAPWIAKKFTIKVAQDWSLYKFSAEQAQSWIDAGWHDAYRAKKQRELQLTHADEQGWDDEAEGIATHLGIEYQEAVAIKQRMGGAGADKVLYRWDKEHADIAIETAERFGIEEAKQIGTFLRSPTSNVLDRYEQLRGIQLPPHPIPNTSDIYRWLEWAQISGDLDIIKQLMPRILLSRFVHRQQGTPEELLAELQRGEQHTAALLEAPPAVFAQAKVYLEQAYNWATATYLRTQILAWRAFDEKIPDMVTSAKRELEYLDWNLENLADRDGKQNRSRGQTDNVYVTRPSFGSANAGSKYYSVEFDSTAQHFTLEEWDQFSGNQIAAGTLDEVSKMVHKDVERRVDFLEDRGETDYEKYEEFLERLDANSIDESMIESSGRSPDYVSFDLPFDTEGWRYAVDNKETGTIGFAFYPFKGPEGIGGRYYPDPQQVTVYMGSYYPDHAGGLAAMMPKQLHTLEHELTHAAQSQIQRDRGLRQPGGLPSGAEHTTSEYSMPHAERSIEFYPNLLSEIRGFEHYNDSADADDKMTPREWVDSYPGSRFDAVKKQDEKLWRKMVTEFMRRVAGRVNKMLRVYTLDELEAEAQKLSGISRRTRRRDILDEAVTHLKDVQRELQYRRDKAVATEITSGAGQTKTVRLDHIAQVGSPLHDADFWLQRRGSEESCGRVRDGSWAQYDIGVKLRPEYAQYLAHVRSHMYLLWSQGYWRPYAHGMLALKSIRTRDVRVVKLEIPVGDSDSDTVRSASIDVPTLQKEVERLGLESMEAYNSGDLDLAEDLDAEFAEKSDLLENALADTGTDAGADWEMDDRSIDSLMREFSAIHHNFAQGTTGSYGVDNEADMLRAVADDYGWLHGGFDGNTTDAELIEAAEDAHQRVRELRRKASDESGRANRVDCATKGFMDALVDVDSWLPEDRRGNVPWDGEERITIWRSVPEGVDTIRAGDWVSLDADWAELHDRGGEVLSLEVPAAHVFWAGTDENEWFYCPVDGARKEAATIVPEMGDVIAAIDMSKDMIMSAADWNEFVDAMSPVQHALQSQNVWLHLGKKDKPYKQFPRRYILVGAAAYSASPSGNNPYLRLTLDIWLPEDTSTISWPTMRAELIERIGHELIHVQQFLKSKGKSGPSMTQDYLSNPQEFSAKAWNIAQQLIAARPEVLHEPFGQIPWQLSEEYKEEYERNYGGAKFLKKLKRKVIDMLQVAWPSRDELLGHKTAGKETLPVNTILYHGTVEELVGEGIRTSIDGLAWFAESPAASKSYIPTAGARSLMSLRRSDDPIRPDRDNKKLIEQFFPEIVWDIEYEEDNPHSVRSWGAKDSEDNYVEPPTSNQLIEKLEALGYEDDPDNSGYSWCPKSGLLLGDGWEVMPADWQEQGQLISIRVRQPINLYDMTEDEGDLMNPQHLEIDKFNELQEAGYDGVRINDFLQHKEWGNVGHESVGLFASGLAKIDYHDIEPATHPSSEELMGRKATASATLEALYNEIYERAVAAGAIKSDESIGTLNVNGLQLREPETAMQRYLAAGTEDEVREYLVSELEPQILEYEAGASARLEQNEQVAVEERAQGQAHEVEFVDDLPESGPVWAWHATSSELLSDIMEFGLSPKLAGSTWQGEQSGVYLSLRESGVGIYGERAVAQHGGEPVVLRVLVDAAHLSADPDDADIASGAWQVIHYGTIEPSSIWQVNETWTKTAGPQRLTYLQNKYPLHIETIQLLANSDPTAPQYKYLDWAVKSMLSLADVQWKADLSRYTRLSGYTQQYLAKQQFRSLVDWPLSLPPPSKDDVTKLLAATNGRFPRTEQDLERWTEQLIAVEPVAGRHNLKYSMETERKRMARFAKMYVGAIEHKVERFHDVGRHLGKSEKQLTVIEKRIERTENKIIRLGRELKNAEDQSNEKKELLRQLDFAERDVPLLREELVLATAASYHPSDINQYNTVDILVALDAGKEYAETQFDRTKAEYSIVYSDSDWKVLEAKNKEAAVVLGSGADWCTSSWNSEHYDKYMIAQDVHKISGEPRLLFIEGKGKDNDRYLVYADTTGQVHALNDVDNNEINVDDTDLSDVFDALDLQAGEPVTVYFMTHLDDHVPISWSSRGDFSDDLENSDEWGLEIRGNGYEIYSVEVSASVAAAYFDEGEDPDPEDYEGATHLETVDPELEDIYVVTDYKDKEHGTVYYTDADQGDAEQWVEDHKGEFVQRSDSWKLWKLSVPVHELSENDVLFLYAQEISLLDDGGEPLSNEEYVHVVTKSPELFELYKHDIDEEPVLISSFATQLEAEYAAQPYSARYKLYVDGKLWSFDVDETTQELLPFKEHTLVDQEGYSVLRDTRPSAGPRKNDAIIWADGTVSRMGHDDYVDGGLTEAQSLVADNPGIEIWKEESTPIDVTEDLAQRKPTKGTGTFRLVRAGRVASSVLVDDAIDTLADNDIGLRQQLEQAARELYAEGHEDWEVVELLGQRRERGQMEKGIAGAEYVDSLDGFDVYRIDTFAAAKRLGTRNWCMVRSADIWDDYAQQGVTFYFHIDKNGPPAAYAVGEMTQQGQTATETWNNKDEIQLEDIGGVSAWHKERGSRDLGVEFYSMLKGVMRGDLGAQNQILTQPRTDEMVEKFFDVKRLSPDLLVQLAEGFAETGVDAVDWLERAGANYPDELALAMEKIAYGVSYNLLEGLTTADFDKTGPVEGEAGPTSAPPSEHYEERGDDRYKDRALPDEANEWTNEQIGPGKVPEVPNPGTRYSPAGETDDTLDRSKIVRSGEIVDSVALVMGLVPEDISWGTSVLKDDLEYLRMSPADVGSWVPEKLAPVIERELEDEAGMEMLGLGFLEFGVADTMNIEEDGSLILWRHV